MFFTKKIENEKYIILFNGITGTEILSPLLRLYRRNYKANAYLRRGNASPHEIRTGRNHRPSL